MKPLLDGMMDEQKCVLVCGGRRYDGVGDFHKVMNALHSVQPIGLIIHGGATGADSMSGNWAKTKGIAVRVFPADWEKHGRAAGPIRNKQMLDEGKPDLVVAFPGGKGTENMIKQARERGVKVITCTLPNSPNPSA